ncbi:hypothetical protein B0O99DRAFT_509148 [Bisporella sp. PMI_857]|nr:hypothetical protein B0O99DRAFT_509148 [Bisporella sp. PMI_857]
MRAFAHFGALLLHFGIASPQQTPLSAPNLFVEDFNWNFNYSSSAPHYFASAYGLMQQWSNTFFPNGHSIVPCEVPAYTKLYHGRMDGDVPPSPEWLAFDIGMSYGIMGGSRNSHMLIYQTTRPVKCIYFDGESATLFGSGQLDSQMLHIWGNITGPPQNPEDRFRGLWEEYARAIGLCDWIEDKNLGGRGWGFEGIVRMNAGFEMIWCNFTSPSLRLVSHLNVTAPLLPTTAEDYEAKEATKTSYYPLPPEPTRPDKATDPANPPAPPNWRQYWGREPFSKSQSWNWIVASTKHYGSDGGAAGLGENRVRLLGCGFLSYYSEIFSSQSLARVAGEKESLNLTEDGIWKGPGSNGTRYGGLTSLTRRRRLHTLGDTSSSDAAVMRSNSERVLSQIVNGTSSCSGMDWTVMTNEIVQTYAEPLPSLLKVLNKLGDISHNNKTAVKEWLASVREDTHTFLLPFIQYPENSTGGQYTRNSQLFNNTYLRCRFHSTRLLDLEEGISLNPEESALKWAVEEVMGGICNVLVDVGLSVESLWQQKFNLVSTADERDTIDRRIVEQEVLRWIEGVEELMAWLGWAGEWAQCDRKCEWDERCYIPMWPLIMIGGGPGRGPGRGPPYRPPQYGYDKPDYGYAPGYGPSYPGFPSNRTGRPPGHGFWLADESGLWQPRCISLATFFGP